MAALGNVGGQNRRVDLVQHKEPMNAYCACRQHILTIFRLLALRDQRGRVNVGNRTVVVVHWSLFL
jgi:hypothetical protein